MATLLQAWSHVNRLAARSGQCVHCDGADFHYNVTPSGTGYHIDRRCMMCGDTIGMKGVGLSG